MEIIEKPGENLAWRAGKDVVDAAALRAQRTQGAPNRRARPSMDYSVHTFILQPPHEMTCPNGKVVEKKREQSSCSLCRVISQEN